MNITLSSLNWRRASAAAVRPEIASCSPSRCSSLPLSSSPSNDRPISVTMPTSLWKVYTVSGVGRVGSGSGGKKEKDFGGVNDFRASQCECVCLYRCPSEGVLKDLQALGDTDWTVSCFKPSQVQVRQTCVRDFVFVCVCLPLRCGAGRGVSLSSHAHHLKHLYKKRGGAEIPKARSPNLSTANHFKTFLWIWLAVTRL